MISKPCESSLFCSSARLMSANRSKVSSETPSVCELARFSLTFPYAQRRREGRLARSGAHGNRRKAILRAVGHVLRALACVRLCATDLSCLLWLQSSLSRRAECDIRQAALTVASRRNEGFRAVLDRSSTGQRNASSLIKSNPKCSKAEIRGVLAFCIYRYNNKLPLLNRLH